jgi:hypothetical protein
MDGLGCSEKILDPRSTNYQNFLKDLRFKFEENFIDMNLLDALLAQSANHGEVRIENLHSGDAGNFPQEDSSDQSDGLLYHVLKIFEYSTSQIANIFDDDDSGYITWKKFSRNMEKFLPHLASDPKVVKRNYEALINNKHDSYTITTRDFMKELKRVRGKYTSQNLGWDRLATVTSNTGTNHDDRSILDLSLIADKRD